jgi:hypothetical protein
MTELISNTNTTRKITRRRLPQISQDKKPLDPETFYTIREISDRTSPYHTASPATIFRALKAGDLKANYVGRKVLLKGAALKAWIEGGDE